MTVSILGADYTVLVKKYDEDPRFAKEDLAGYCDSYSRCIVVGALASFPGWDDEAPEYVAIAEKECLRHEIVHAFLHESGLSANAARPVGAWPEHEEMVDWIAIQGPKLHAAWQSAGAL